MKLILFMNLTLSLTFFSLTHPLSLGIVLLCQTVIISLITGNLSPTFWFSYILFLIMVGGMLILFIYMTSIASNEKFSFNMKYMMIAMLLPLTMFYSFPLNNSFINKDTLMYNFNPSIQMSINKYISSYSIMIFMFMITYLFIAMIAIVKITKFNSGSLRQKN